MYIDWNHQLTEQLDWHWRTQLRARLEGLSDEDLGTGRRLLEHPPAGAEHGRRTGRLW
jgi:hypothetical protein